MPTEGLTKADMDRLLAEGRFDMLASVDAELSKRYGAYALGKWNALAMVCTWPARLPFSSA